MSKNLGRREFLERVAAVGTAAAALPTAAEAAPAAQSPAQRPLDGAAAHPPSPGTTSAGYTFLTAPEAAFVEAVVDVFVPADELTPSGTNLGIAVFIDRQLAGAWGKGDRLYMQGPWRQGPPGLGYQLPLTPAEFFRAGIDKYFNPFMGAGAQGTRIDDFHANEAFDNGKYGFLGGATIGSSAGDGRPIGFHPVPPGTPRWGSAWKRATAKWYQHVMSIGGTSGNMPDRYHYYDLDPTYKNAFGQPLMRLTYNFTENDFKAREFAGQRSSEIAKSMNATIVTSPNERRDDFSLIPYQSTHNTGGAIMGTNPSTSVVNKYLQSWDVPNVFVVGASAFPHNSAYNPTGPLGALTYWTADAIKNRYIKRPGKLV